jgi:hypothetical protein
VSHHRIVEAADLQPIVDGFLDTLGEPAARHAPGVEAEDQPPPVAVPGIRSFHVPRSSPVFACDGKNIGWGGREL